MVDYWVSLLVVQKVVKTVVWKVVKKVALWVALKEHYLAGLKVVMLDGNSAGSLVDK